MTILYCISDHGYGHATRSIPILNALHSTVIVRTHYPAHIVRHETGKTIIEETNDVGVLLTDDSYAIDRHRTARIVKEWLKGWKADIARIRQIIRENNVRVVVSDSAPQPFLAARGESIPGIFVGSFTWSDVYESLNILTQEEQERIRAAYAAATLGIILPFESPCKGISRREEVGLVVRTPTGTIPDTPGSVVHLIGGSAPNAPAWSAPAFKGTMFLTNQARYRPVGNIVMMDEKIPSIEYIRAADVVIAKSGYGVAAEAVRCRKPVFLFPRKEFIDDETIGRTILALGIGKMVTIDEVQELLNDAFFLRMRAYARAYATLPDRFTRDGAGEAAAIIERVVHENP